MEGRPGITLRLMNGEGHIPSEITPHSLSADCVTHIVQINEREFQVRSDIAADGPSEGLILGNFHRDQWSVVLKPLVEGVTVDAPFSSRHPDTVPIPQDARIFLRSNDSVCFSHQGLTVAIEEEQKQRSEPTSEGEVQVKSSNVEPEPVALVEEETDSSEGEEDLDRSSSAHSQRTPKEVTPATSKPTEVVANVDTVKETPSNARFASWTEDNQFYSTAQATPLDSHEVVGDAESPSVQAQQRSNGESQVRASTNLVNTFEDTLSDQDDDTDNEVLISVRKKQVTYSHSARKRATEASSEVAKDIAAGHDPKSDNNDNEEEVEQSDALTSDPLDVHEVMSTAAIRTINTGSQKRKASDDDVEAEQDLLEARKKQKMDEGSAMPAMPEDAENELNTEDISAKPLKSEQKPRRKGKITSGPRKALRTLQPTQESGEEIHVSRMKSSPEVVIKQRLRSETPSSSAPSSILTGKVPELLFTSDCKAQNKPAVKQLLREAGATAVKEVPSRRTHFVCVVTKQHSLKSAKVLLSLLRGKLIVTEEWLLKSAEAGELLDPADFVHATLEDSITHDRRRTFAGRHLFFSNAAIANYNKDGWTDIQEVAKEAGASEVDKIAFNRPSYLGARDDVMFFGMANGDKDVSRLVNEYSRTVYSKDLFTNSIISGELNLYDDDCKLSPSATLKKGRRS